MPLQVLSRRWLPITLVVLATIALFGRLGVWQLDRLAQRRASNAKIRFVIGLPEVVLPSTEDLAHQEYRRVHAEGVYDFANQLALRNQAHDGQYGFHLLTPLLLTGSPDALGATAVLVDRGWIPAEGNWQPDDWRKFDVTGPVMISGVVRLGQETTGTGLDANADAMTAESADRFALVVDITRITKHLHYGLLPFYVQAEARKEGVLPIAAVPSLDLSEGPHLGYAMQWFGFALILAIGYPAYVRRQDRAEV